MLDLRRSGFDWKEIADVLQMTDVAARAAFWREVKRAKLRAGTGRRKNHLTTAGREEEVEGTQVRGQLVPSKRVAAESADSVGQDFVQADGVADQRPNPRMR
jgi:hypothetical protein